MTTAARSNTPTWRLPPDVVSASWSWTLPIEPIWRPGHFTPTYSQLSSHPYLTCDVKLADTDDYSDLVVRAAHDNGHQTASLSFKCKRVIVGYDRELSITTSQGVVPMRVTSVTRTGAYTAWAAPSSVVAFVKSLEMYTRDEVWF